jgi:hypothetical protein
MPPLEAIKKSAVTLEALRAELAATYPDAEYLIDAGVLYQRVRRTGTDYGLYSTLPDGAVCGTVHGGYTVVHRPIPADRATEPMVSPEPEGGVP